MSSEDRINEEKESINENELGKRYYRVLPQRIFPDMEVHPRSIWLRFQVLIMKRENL